MRRILIHLLAYCVPLLGGTAAADCVEVGRGAGEILAGMTQVELNPAEHELVSERFAPDFAEAARLGIAADALFRFARCDLNAAAPAELVAVGRSPAHCAGAAAFGDRGRAPVCGIWVFAETSEGWVQVLETAGAARVSGSTTSGWRDLVVERGNAPFVMKFGGAVYQEDLGDADPRADALDDYGGYGVGPGGIAWYAFDDPMPEQVERAFLWFYGAEIRAGEGRIGVLPDAFRVGVAELDGAAPEEAVIQGVSPDFCGPEGCENWVLSGLDGDPKVIGRLLGFDLQAASSGGAGGRDLIAATQAGLQVWRNDGDGYALPDGVPAR